MANAKSKIGWTDATWSPVTGCSKVSPGCANCYAEALSLRFGHSKKPWTPENATENVVLHPERLDVPLRWKKPRMVFVNSMSDLFHELVPWEFIAQAFGIMARTPRHTFQVLTKRPERMRELIDNPMFANEVACHAPDLLDGTLFPWPLPNVWLGVSAENQHWADERIPLLLQTPAAVRFVSVEPMLGPVDLVRSVNKLSWLNPASLCPGGLDWVIVGGESGPKRRPFDLAWAHDVAAQCRSAGVPMFFKQTGALRAGTPSGDAALDALKEYPR